MSYSFTKQSLRSPFKALAAKREGKALGYRDSGKNWNALPEGQKAAIDDFNSHSQAARSAILEVMRENIKSAPGAAEKLMQQLEKTNDQDRVAWVVKPDLSWAALPTAESASGGFGGPRLDSSVDNAILQVARYFVYCWGVFKPLEAAFSLGLSF